MFASYSIVLLVSCTASLTQSNCSFTEKIFSAIQNVLFFIFYLFIYYYYYYYYLYGETDLSPSAISLLIWNNNIRKL